MWSIPGKALQDRLHAVQTPFLARRYYLAASIWFITESCRSVRRNRLKSLLAGSIVTNHAPFGNAGAQPSAAEHGIGVRHFEFPLRALSVITAEQEHFPVATEQGRGACEQSRESAVWLLSLLSAAASANLEMTRQERYLVI